MRARPSRTLGDVIRPRYKRCTWMATTWRRFDDCHDVVCKGLRYAGEVVGVRLLLCVRGAGE